VGDQQQVRVGLVGRVQQRADEAEQQHDHDHGQPDHAHAVVAEVADSPAQPAPAGCWITGQQRGAGVEDVG
jgi:hypothetical protein